MIFFCGGSGSRKSNYIVYRCTLSDMVLTMVTWEDKRSKQRMEFIYF